MFWPKNWNLQIDKKLINYHDFYVKPDTSLNSLKKKKQNELQDCHDNLP